jgi:hypothetical protein
VDWRVWLRLVEVQAFKRWVVLKLGLLVMARSWYEVFWFCEQYTLIGMVPVLLCL